LSPLTPRNIVKHELIGIEVKVIRDSNPINQSISGKVIDETRNTLIIKQGSLTRRIAKKEAVFYFRLHDSYIEVHGSNLVARPEDRVKKRNKRALWRRKKIDKF